jgi:hypothetical protein
MEEIRAIARYITARDGLDTIRAKAGRTDALRIASLAGLDTGAIGGNWDQERPVLQQATQDLSLYEADPTYDSRYLDLACRLGPGHPDAVARLRQVRAEQEEARISGEGRLSVRESMARSMAQDQAEAEQHNQHMREAGWERGQHGTWVRRGQPIFEHDTAGGA